MTDATPLRCTECESRIEFKRRRVGGTHVGCDCRGITVRPETIVPETWELATTPCVECETTPVLERDGNGRLQLACDHDTEAVRVAATLPEPWTTEVDGNE